MNVRKTRTDRHYNRRLRLTGRFSRRWRREFARRLADENLTLRCRTLEGRVVRRFSPFRGWELEIVVNHDSYAPRHHHEISTIFNNVVHETN